MTTPVITTQILFKQHQSNRLRYLLLDKGAFSPLNLPWRDVCHNFTVKNPGKCVSRYEFSKLFSEAWSRAMTFRNIIDGFEYVILVLEGT